MWFLFYFIYFSFAWLASMACKILVLLLWIERGPRQWNQSPYHRTDREFPGFCYILNWKTYFTEQLVYLLIFCSKLPSYFMLSICPACSKIFLFPFLPSVIFLKVILLFPPPLAFNVVFKISLGVITWGTMMMISNFRLHFYLFLSGALEGYQSGITLFNSDLSLEVPRTTQLIQSHAVSPCRGWFLPVYPSHEGIDLQSPSLKWRWFFRDLYLQWTLNFVFCFLLT